MLSDNQKTILLTLARNSIKAHLSGASMPDLKQLVSQEPSDSPLADKLGCFVTLKTKEQDLRGCIGLIEADTPLVNNIMEYGIFAATKDPRFPAVQLQELGDLSIEISVLGKVLPVKDLASIQVGTHGLIATKGSYRGLLLPQVPTEWGWDREEFIQHTCQKAGLPADAYKDGSVDFSYFSAFVFSEN